MASIKLIAFFVSTVLSGAVLAQTATFESACKEIKGDIPANTTQVVCRTIGSNFNASIHHDQGKFLWGAVAIDDGKVTKEALAAMDNVAQGLIGVKIPPSLMDSIKAGSDGQNLGLRTAGHVLIWHGKDAKRKRDIGALVIYPDQEIPAGSVVCRVAGCKSDRLTWLK